MLTNFSNWIVKALSESGLISEKDKDLYSFGVQTALLKMIHFSTMLIVGLFLGMLLETFVFIVSYSFLRVYAGGYHAKTKLGCYGMSWVMILFVLLLTKFCPGYMAFITSIAVLIPASLIIVILAPVENINKPLDDAEVHHYRRKTRIILSVEFIVTIIFLLISSIQFSFIVSLSIFWVSVMLILGKAQMMMVDNVSV